MSDVPTDEDLIVALRGGDTAVLGLLVARWQQPLFRFVFRMVPREDDARDLCQETFLRVLDKAPRFRDGAKFSTWMYQIALNLCRDRARRTRRWGKLLAQPRERDDGSLPEAAAPAEDDDHPEFALRTRERREAVRRALDALPVEQREVVVLKEYEGLKFREIAEVLGVPESTVKSRMYFALDAMRDTLLPERPRP